MDIRFTSAETIPKFIANTLESFLVIEFPTYEYLDDMGTSAYRIAADQNRFDIWIEGDVEIPIGAIIEGDSSATAKEPAKIVIRNMDLFTAD
ncbi:MAG: hypothetical protein QF535_02370 [Anaerolineales bacterium]|nr:hypothetical protein [Anaerolineales bacterium]